MLAPVLVDTEESTSSVDRPVSAWATARHPSSSRELF